jgi:type II secretory ATPase GspE/PulE/Tfp pilus assembly ATPase PilB-like protein
MLDNEIRQKIVKCGTEDEIRKLSRDKGYGSLMDSGIEAMLQGLTTPQEIFRVTFADK